MDRFPKMLYRFPAQGQGVQLEDGVYDTCAVANEAELDAALTDGWHTIWPAARQAHADAQAAEAAAAARDAGKGEKAPATRAEMELKATQLGLKFDGRTKDAKLLHMIEAALAPA